MKKYICTQCHAEFEGESELENFGGSLGHVITVAGRNGEPEPDMCGPVEEVQGD